MADEKPKKRTRKTGAVGAPALTNPGLAKVARALKKSPDVVLVLFDGSDKLLVSHSRKIAWFVGDRAMAYVEAHKVPTEKCSGVSWPDWCRERGITWHERDILGTDDLS
jgi:hypothetical protein